MFKLLLNFKGKPSLVMQYRGKNPVKAHARRQRAIYKADSVAVFDESNTLICTVLPTRKVRMPKRTKVQKCPAD